MYKYKEYDKECKSQIIPLMMWDFWSWFIELNIVPIV